MATFLEASQALDDFRASVNSLQRSEVSPDESTSMPARGAFSAFATPMTNIHATGIGVRIRGGKIDLEEFVLKVFVFDKIELGRRTPAILSKDFQGVGIDVEHLPVQMAYAKKKSVAKKPLHSKRAASSKINRASISTTPAQHQARRRPVIGGIQISPRGANFVGTLGCFVQRGTQLFALSNNHVLADTNRLAIGSEIVQSFGSDPNDVFARLTEFEPIRFPSVGNSAPRNRIDAAIAAVTSPSLIQSATMFGIANYTPTMVVTTPGMQVTKSGRTTGVTTGTVTSIRVNGILVNYGTQQSPMIATFDNCVRILGGASPFSAPGDSGSVILESSTGKPTALLFAGDGTTTTACSLAEVLTRFNVLPA